MQTGFIGFYRPTEDEFKALWGDALFIFDASVLLNIYGYSASTRKRLLAVLDQLASRLRIPHQFAVEYQRNRVKAIMEQVKNYERVKKVLNDLLNHDFAPKHKHPFLEKSLLTEFQRICDRLEKGRAEHAALLTDDPYHRQVSGLFNGRVGAAPTGEVLDSLHKVAKVRYAASIPPGYADVKEKGEPDCFGDYVGWAQVIEIGKSESKSVILITDDAKEDWWYIFGERTIGPRADLLKEFHAECGNMFYMYSSSQFLLNARRFLAAKVPAQTLSEVQERLRAQAREALEGSAASSAASATPKRTEPEAKAQPIGSASPMKPKREAEPPLIKSVAPKPPEAATPTPNPPPTKRTTES